MGVSGRGRVWEGEIREDVQKDFFFFPPLFELIIFIFIVCI